MNLMMKSGALEMFRTVVIATSKFVIGFLAQRCKRLLCAQSYITWKAFTSSKQGNAARMLQVYLSILPYNLETM